MRSSACASDFGKQQLDLSGDWTFRRGRASRRWLTGLGADDGEGVTLPHCWNRTDTFQPGVAYYRGRGAYRRRFLCPDGVSGGPAWLCSDGFYGMGEVWLNGQRAGAVNGQYIGFRLPVGRLIRAGAENFMAVHLTNRCRRRELPGIRYPDFLLYGGLSGRVWLETAGDLHLDEARTWVEAIGGEAPRVHARVCAVNAGALPVEVSVVWTLRDEDGTILTREESGVRSVPAASGAGVSVSLAAPQARPWSPERPRLYEVESTLFHGRRAVDRATRRIGFRTAEFRPGAGFFLNGARLMLRGCNRHESMPGCGNALLAGQHRADAEAIRDMGLNFVRLSHYPQSPAFLDACDELGILVYAELSSWKSVRGGAWLRRAARQFEDMIRRDRHHPSVILWGMGNEGRHRAAYRALRALAKRLDPGRPVTYAENHLYRARRKGTMGLPDVWGCNYELDALEAGREACRLRCVVVSECSNAPYAQRGDLDAERKQIDQLAADLPRIEAAACAAGFAVWCFNDYATLRKARYVRYSGMVDAWREPKLAAHWLRARYRTEPFVKLAADWQPESGAAGALRRVDLLTSLESVEIRINHRAVRTVKGRGHHVLRLPFEPGRIEAGPVDGHGPSDAVETAGGAARLRLSPMKGSGAMLRLEILDGTDRRVRDWQGEVAVATEGGARAFPYREGRVRVDGGVTRIPVSVEENVRGGAWRVSAPGLAPARLPVTALISRVTRPEEGT